MLASLSIAVPLLFYLHQHGELLRYGYQIEALKKQQTELSERRRTLAVELLSAASLSTVDERAARMGLVAPPPTDVIASMDTAARSASPDGASAWAAHREVTVNVVGE